MNELTITAKGQITLRKDVLKHLGTSAGQKVTYDKRPDGTVVLRPQQKTGKISDIYGMFKGRSKKKLSIKEMNVIIAKGWAGEL